MLTTVLSASIATCLAVLTLARGLRTLGRRPPTGLLRRTEADLAMLFIFISAPRLRIVAIAGVGVSFAIARLLGCPWFLCALLASLVSLLPRVIVGFLRQRWRRRITAQLPDALAMWAGLLRAGQAMAPALSQLTSRQANPLGAELRLVLSQYRLGVGLDVAIARFRDRAGVPDLQMLATLLRAHRELGGNLAEALDRLAGTLRSRLGMESRIRSLTAQGRLQGIVVGTLPLFLAAVLTFMDPTSMKSMVETPLGWAAIGLVAVLELAGFTMIRRIVNIDV